MEVLESRDCETSQLEQFVIEQTALMTEAVEELRNLQLQLAQQKKQQDETRALVEHILRFVRFVERMSDPFGLRQRLVSRLFHLHQYTAIPLRIPRHYKLAIMPQRPPLISLVTPSFNQAQFLPRTIESVLSQGYPRLEYIVQDGGSSDGSVDVLRNYDARLTHWTSAPDGGQSNAINRGFARTSGTIMGWLNSDDLLLPGALATVARYFERHPDIDVVYGSRIIIDAQDREIGRWLLPDHDQELLRWLDYVPQESLFWRREIWERSGGRIDESFDFAMDWDLLLRFQAAGAKFACLPRYLGAFRVTEFTKTSQRSATVGQSEVDRLRRRTLGFVPTPDQIAAEARPYLKRHIWRRLLHRCRLVSY
jgi:hypothetical protein